MKVSLYFIECLTNLHVGSGEANYNIVDMEVEKDPIYDYPIINASGLKGAIRQVFEQDAGIPADTVNRIFGKPAQKDTLGAGGSHSFFDGRFLCRPLRFDGAVASVNVTTVEALQDILRLTEKFGIRLPMDINFLEELDFEENVFWSSVQGSVEGDRSGILPATAVQALKPFLGKYFAITKASLLRDYPLPVIARNSLKMKTGGLWYEEYVPRESRFYMMVLSDGQAKDELDAMLDNRILQLGGNASVGYGFCEFKKFAEGVN